MIWSRVLLVAVAASSVGCVSVPQKADKGAAVGPSVAEKRYEQETNWLARTDVQSALIGGILTGSVCILAGQSPGRCAAAALVGAGGGYIIGKQLDVSRMKSGEREKSLNQAITGIREDNAKVERMIAAQQAVVDEKVAELNGIQQGYRKRTLVLGEAQSQLSEVEKTKTTLIAKASQLKEKEKEWVDLNNQFRSSEIDQELDRLRGKIGQIDQTLSILTRSIDETHRIIAAG